MKKEKKKLFEIEYDTLEEKEQAEKEERAFKLITRITAIFIGVLATGLFLLFLYLYILN